MSCHFVFFFNDTATTEIYTLSLHDALPILLESCGSVSDGVSLPKMELTRGDGGAEPHGEHWLELHLRSEEHTSELQSRQYLVCRLLLEKKKIIITRRQNLEYTVD